MSNGKIGKAYISTIPVCSVCGVHIIKCSLCGGYFDSEEQVECHNGARHLCVECMGN